MAVEERIFFETGWLAFDNDSRFLARKRASMAGDSGKPFDPLAQFAELQTLLGGYFNPFKMIGGPLMGGPASFMRYETIDPQVQEIAILATMHNMASLLKDPGRIKSVISAELSERSKKLDSK